MKFKNRKEIDEWYDLKWISKTDFQKAIEEKVDYVVEAIVEYWIQKDAGENTDGIVKYIESNNKEVEYISQLFWGRTDIFEDTIKEKAKEIYDLEKSKEE